MKDVSGVRTVDIHAPILNTSADVLDPLTLKDQEII
jgi:hypothetical protein